MNLADRDCHLVCSLAFSSPAVRVRFHPASVAVL
jgi:hypothetical protein